MTSPERRYEWQVAECLVPGLTLPAAEQLGRRITAELAGRPRPASASSAPC